MIDKAALGKLSTATPINRDLHAVAITYCCMLEAVLSMDRTERVKNVPTPLKESKPCCCLVDDRRANYIYERPEAGMKGHVQLHSSALDKSSLARQAMF